MKCSSKLAVLLALLVGSIGWPARPADAQATQTYLFRDSFVPSEGTGNVLVPVSNDTGTILASGPGFVNGAFVTVTIGASACGTTPTIRAWSFPAMAGLRHDNDGPTVVTGSYSISMLMRFDPMDGGYARLVDFSNSTLDTGIYKLGDGVSFYPVGTYAAGSFVTGQDVFVTITRDAGTQLVSLYINGVPSGTYTDVSNLYAPSATTLYFLLDNTTGSAPISETDPGVIAYLQLRDAPMTPEQVTASLSTICEVVSASTTTVPGQTTTTTTLPGCSGGSAPTFASIICRIESLLARVNGEPELGTFQPKLAKSLETARSRATDARTLCDGGNLKKAKKRLQQSGKGLTQYAHRLAGRAARKKLDDALRTDFLQAGQAIVPDVKSLRSQASCPPS